MGEDYPTDVAQTANGLLTPNKKQSEEPGETSAQKTEASPSKEQNAAQNLQNFKYPPTEKELLDRTSHEFEVHGKKVRRDKRSLYCFDYSFKLRYAFVWFVEWVWFDRFITFVILLNSLLLAFTDYQERVEPDYVSPRNEFFAKIDLVFSIIFLIECGSKLIANGFVFSKTSYLRDYWNWLDFFIVIVSIIGWMPFFDAGALKGLRTFRILRPLRSINSLPEMKNLISTMLTSLPGLINVLFFLMFIFGIFAIFGVNQFNGELYNRCRTTEEPIYFDDGTVTWPEVDFEGWLCSSDDACAAQVEEGDLLKCGNLGKEYRINPTKPDSVIDQESIQYGIVGFDEIGQGMQTIFQVLTLEGWSDLTYNYSDANDPTIAVIFFVSIVIMGAFFSMNLVLGQIIDSFNEEAEKQREEKLQQKEDKARIEKAEKEQMAMEAKDKGEDIDTVPATERKMIEGKDDMENPEKDEKKVWGDNPLYDSTESHYFGYNTPPPDDAESLESGEEQPEGSEQEYERASRKRARNKGCVQLFYRLVQSVGFNFFIFLLIIANTMTLALYSYDQSDKKELILSYCNEFFTWAFTAELVFKLIGLGPKNYVKDFWNQFDAVVVTISLIDWVIAKSLPPEMIGSAGEALNAFRAMRLLRVLKLARLWGALAKILSQTMASLKDLVWYAALLFLFMFIFALLGMELFAMELKYDADDEIIKGPTAIQEVYAAGEVLNSPRENFDTIDQALTTIFIVIVGEDWNWVLYAFVRAKGYDSQLMYYLVIFYFTMLMILGNIMLFSLFTAILLANFEGDMSEAIQAAKERALEESTGGDQMKKSITQRLVDKDTWKKFLDGFNDAFSAHHKRRPRPSKKIIRTEEDQKNEIFDLDKEYNEERSVEPEPFDPAEEAIEEKILSPEKSKRSGEEQDEWNMKSRPSALRIRPKRSILMHYEKQEDEQDTEVSQKFEREDPYKGMHGTSLFCFSKTNGFRRMCWTVCKHKWFDNTILLLIVISTLTLAVETPFDDPDGQKIEILTWIDYFMTGAFTLECITKIIAMGFVHVTGTYLRDPWNNLDFIIVLSAVAGYLMPPGVNISAVKSLRILRILRPLKIISKNKSLKIALTSLVKSIPKIANLQIIIFFFMFLLSILQTTLLSGKFYRCHTDHLEHLSYREQEVGIIDKWDCINSGGEWLNPYLHFDNTLWSLLTLFTIQTTEGWIGVMWDSTNAVGVDMQPQEQFAPYMVIVFIILIIIISMLFLNLFVGVVIETFNAESELLSNNQHLRPQQKAWISVQIMTYGAKPQLRTVKTGSVIKDFCVDIVTYKGYFDLFIMGCIIGNTIVLAIKWYIMPLWIVSVIEVVNYVFMVIFTLEAVIKIIAMGGNYFKESWNIFDFTVVVMTALILGITWLGVGGNLGVTSTILRSLRIGRIFRLVKKAEKLQIIFQALLDAIPSMGSLGLLLFLLIFMYAIIGISQFALIKIDGGLVDIEGYYLGQDAMHKHANFQSFGNAFLTLFRCATGEAWNSIMFDSARSRSILFQCREKEDFYTWMAAGGTPYDAFACGSPAIAFGYHMSFQIIVSQVFLNIFIAIIIDSFAGQADAFNLPVKQAEIDQFVELWAQYDPHATGFIDAKNLEQLLIDVAESDTACALILKPEQLVPEFEGDTADEKDFDVNCLRRRRYMAMLDIPMYDEFKKVMFYDVLQQLSIFIVMYKYNEDRIKKNKQKLRAISTMKHGGSSQLDDTIGAITCGKYQDLYDVEFHSFSTGSKQQDDKIELMNELKKKVSEVGKRAHIKKVDLRSNVDERLDGIYTTKHFVYGSFIKEIIVEAKRFPINERKSLMQKPTKQVKKKTHLVPKRDTNGQLGQIEEVESVKEQTNNKTSQRQSQVGEESEGPVGIGYAINEQEEDESMQRDTAFMNDKRHLR